MELIGKYVVHRRIMTTGYSRLFHCIDPDLQIPVAIKIFDPTPHKLERERQYSLEVWRARFVQEARVLASLDHPHIITVKQLSRLENGLPYFVMPYMAANLPFEIGRDTFDPEAISGLPARERPRPLPPARALQLLRQLLSALALMHARGIVHRDIKPTNLLLTTRENGQLKLCDLGMIKRREDSSLSREGVWIGTPDYMAPEQKQSATRADARADIYSVGVLAYRMLTGRLPVGNFPPPRHFVPTLPLYVSNLIMAAMRPNRDVRPKDAADMLQRLNTPPAQPKVSVVAVKKEVIKHAAPASRRRQKATA
jgi:serine/threonine-protein kinase